MTAEEHANNIEVKPVVEMTGTAREGKIGPPVGMVDIGVSENSYLFRVALPGLSKDHKNLKVEILSNGMVHISGEIANGILSKDTRVYRMVTQQLCPAGPFTVSFSLPGPVDNRMVSPRFRQDGILEVMVMKERKRAAVSNGNASSSYMHKLQNRV